MSQLPPSAAETRDHGFRLPAQLSLSSNYNQWVYGVETYFYAKEWHLIFAWMTSGVVQEPAPIVIAASFPPVAAIPAPVAIAVVPSLPSPVVVPANDDSPVPRGRPAKRRKPAVPAAAPVVGLAVPVPAAAVPFAAPQPAARPIATPAIPGTLSQRHQAWGVLSSSIGMDVLEKIPVPPKIGDLVALWAAVQACFFKSSSVSKYALKSKLLAISCSSSGGPDKFIAALRDIFSMLAKAGAPVEDADKLFYFVRGLPAEFDHFKASVDANEANGVPYTFESILRHFHTYYQRVQTKEFAYGTNHSDSALLVNSTARNPPASVSAAGKSRVMCRSLLSKPL